MSKIITKIEAQKKKDSRVNIYINDEFAFGCSSELVYYHNLTKGKEIDIKELETIVEEDNYITAKSLGLKYVETSLKTEFQVREYLNKKEYSESIINRVINFLTEYKFIDDVYFANAFTKQYIRNQGKNNIRQKLLQKGINEEIIDDTLKEFTREDEVSVALNLTEKKLITLSKKEKDIRKIKMKINTFLISKGYNFHIINEVIGNFNIKEYINNYGEVEEAEASDGYISNPIEDKDSSVLLEIAEKRYCKLKNSETDKYKLKKKLHDFLLRKGYGFDEIKSVINKLIEESEE